MLYRLRTRLAKRLFDLRIEKILRTAPIVSSADGPVIMSMVSSQDVRMYLLAIKSFHTRLGTGGVVVIDDGSLTMTDRRLLRDHIEGLEFRDHQDIDLGGIRRDIMWERLCFNLAYCQSRPVIQLDSDTVTTGPVAEVATAVASGTAFILGTSEGQRITSAANASRHARTTDSQHVQSVAERALGSMPNADRLRYVRGSSGFFGLPRASVHRDDAVALFEKMAKLCGPKFREWGSEQFAANYLVANCPDAVVLPWPAYTSVEPGVDIGRSVFLHFIGTYRFRGGEYVRQGQRALSSIPASWKPSQHIP